MYLFQSWMWTIIFTVFLFQVLHPARGICTNINAISWSFTFGWDKTYMKKIFLFVLRLLGLTFYCNNRLNMVLCWSTTFGGNWTKGNLYVILWDHLVATVPKIFIKCIFCVMHAHATVQGYNDESNIIIALE